MGLQCPALLWRAHEAAQPNTHAAPEMTELRISRNPGAYGRFAGLDVVVDNQTVATLREGEQRLLQHIEDGALVHVEMQGHVRSPRIRISGESVAFDCGPNRWLAIDWFDLCYLPGLRERVFYLRPTAKQR